MKQVDLTRLKNCMRRAMKGEKLTIGFFGGSITQGCLATEHERAYSWGGKGCWGSADVSAGCGCGGFQRQ